MSKNIKKTYFVVTGIILAGLIAGIYFHKYYPGGEEGYDIGSLHESYFYLNHDKNVAYVGNDKCMSCHLEIHNSFHLTGMGRSFYRLSPENEIENFTENNIIYDPNSDYYYQVYKEGNEYFQREFRKNKNGKIVHELKKKIDFIMGSGNSTRSYLFHESGFFYEMPVSWYTEKAKWDLSPGYQNLNLRFSRPIVQECMNCHNDYAGHIDFSENKFSLPLPEGISCERCHGPGELHIKRHTEETDLFENIEQDTIDRTIVNPADLPLEENLSVCFQCHLQGDVRVFADGRNQTDFKPGMLLGEVKTVFVQDILEKGDFKIASHAARMYLSDCFVKSNGGITCITCHDPHIPVQSTTKEFFNTKCTGCHNVSSLSPKTVKADHTVEGNCIGCHMKQGATADVLHVNFTDHWIRKEIHSEKESKEPDKNNSDKIHEIAITLKNFNNPDDKYANINLGIAYVIYHESKHPHREYLKRAIPLLEESLGLYPDHKNGLYHLAIAYLRVDRITDGINTLNKLLLIDPGNARAHFYLGYAYDRAMNRMKAMESYQKSLNIFPEDITVLHYLGNLYYDLDRINEAVNTYMKAINLVSNNPGILNNLGEIYLYKLNMTDAARDFLNRALEYDPDLMPALNNLGNMLMLSGKVTEAEAVFKQVLEKDPENIIAYGNLAVIFEERGDIASAKRMLSKVLEIDPNDVRAKQMMEKLNGNSG